MLLVFCAINFTDLDCSILSLQELKILLSLEEMNFNYST